ncbi:glycosyl transferase [Methylosinus sp. C49]|uniref:sugar transferase n=1 Tax=Methylosinus sp. C49 TaxID=2699395 RepID=UPI00136795C4|nr:sugar transferase [Methylosinus sp. C49]BBU63717.1 glycosyl transferase [Methylosinus sp. C49]
MQRIFDILLSASALALLSPFLILLVLLLRLTGEGKVFFRQKRIGKDGAPFNLYKFATMLENSPNIGAGTVTIKDDPRILPVGAMLRRTKINELPQLLNILLGDMSLIGPRPQTKRCFDAFPPALQSVIVKVRPGLSGLGAVVFRGEEDILPREPDKLCIYDQIIAPYKGQIEAWYIEHATLDTYFAIIAVTIWTVLFPGSDLVWRVFVQLPEPPDELKSALHYPATLGSRPVNFE